MDSPVEDGTLCSKFQPSGTISPVPVSKESMVYNINFRDRHAYIFNQVNFKKNLNLSARPESIQMASNLANALIQLDFNFVHIFTDMAYNEIKYELKTISKDKRLEHCACILIVVMTHGRTEGIYAKDTHYMPEKLKSYFDPKKCQFLIGKPKLFIIQACRGDIKDVGIGVGYADKGISTRNHLIDSSANCTYKLSTNADFLTAFATIYRYVAYRNLFIPVLTEELSKPEVKNGLIDFLSMMTIVQRRVSVEDDEEKQIPSVISTLTRKFFFKIT